MEAGIEAWMNTLETRHLAELTFSEVSRALRALSSAYVERRSRLREGAALSGAGKRAAFALFYGPLHFLIVQHIVQALDAHKLKTEVLVDLGCGTGAAGAAWSHLCASPPRIVGIDRHPWALQEAVATYRHFGLRGQTRNGDIAAAAWPKSPAAMVAAFAINELDSAQRASVLRRFLDRTDPILIIEPLAGAVAPWWNEWRATLSARGARADEWRFTPELPPIVEKLDRAAGLNHQQLTARSLALLKS